MQEYGKIIMIAACVLLIAAIVVTSSVLLVKRKKADDAAEKNAQKIASLTEPEFKAEFSANNERKSDFAALHALLSREKPLTWLFAGDSITHGCMHTGYFCNFSELFEKYIKKSAAERANDIIINTAASSGTTEDMEKYFKEWILNPDADVAFISFGTNDCGAEGLTPEKFYSNLLHAVSALRERGAIPILQTPNVSARQKELEPYLEKMRVLAQDEEVLLIDINAMWSENAAATQLMMSDALHPNAAGHLTWCRFMLKSLGMYSEESELAKVTYADISREYEPESQQHKIKTDKEISAALAEFINNSEPVTWVFVGGESTEGLNLPMQFRSYVSHFNEAVRWEIAMDSLAKRSKTIINSGRAGYLPDNILKNYDELAGRFNPDVLVYLPDLSGAKLSADSLEEGGEFYKALMSLSEKATGNGAKLLLLTPPEIADKETAELLKAALSDAAEKFGAIFIDTAEILPKQENAADSHFALGRALALTCTKLPKTSRMK